MRKQYYFEPSAHGFFAWDVDRLIKMSQHLPRKRIQLNQLREVDESFWRTAEKPTLRSVAEHCKLVAEADLSFPILLSKNGKVMDGLHRIVKALMQERDEIDAIQFTEALEPDYRDVLATDLPYD
jgi:hypothetical protein